MKCDCVERIDEKLDSKNLNTVISVPLSFKKDMSDTPQRTMVVTEKKDLSVRKKPTNVFASYCPFCGIKY